MNIELTIKRYVVGLTVLEVRSNLLIRIKAVSEYEAVIGALGRYNKILAASNPENSERILNTWEVEKERLTRVCKDYADLHNYLAMLGMIISKPLLLHDFKKGE